MHRCKKARTATDWATHLELLDCLDRVDVDRDPAVIETHVDGDDWHGRRRKGLMMATLRELSCKSALAVRSWRAEGRGIRGERVRLQVRERANDGLKYNVRECDGRDDAALTAHSTDGARTRRHTGTMREGTTGRGIDQELSRRNRPRRQQCN
jgi:hypothetical protein